MRISCLLGVEELHTVLSCLLLLVLIHQSEVVTLWVEIEFECDSVVESSDCCLSGRNLNETNSWMLVVSWECGINEAISARRPHQIFDSIDCNRLFNSIRRGDKLHGRKLVNTDTSLYFSLLHDAIFLVFLLSELFG